MLGAAGVCVRGGVGLVGQDGWDAPIAQLAEAAGLNPAEYGFESRWGHTGSCGTEVPAVTAITGPGTDSR